MAKKISAFKNICEQDQVALLKGKLDVFYFIFFITLIKYAHFCCCLHLGGCVEMMILRSVMQYDCDRATWKVGSHCRSL